MTTTTVNPPPSHPPSIPHYHYYYYYYYYYYSLESPHELVHPGDGHEGIHREQVVIDWGDDKAVP